MEQTRRDFLWTCAAGLASLATGGFVVGCAPVLPTLKETREDVANITWDCNPVLPIPKVGCFTGTNCQGSQIGWGGYYPRTRAPQDQAEECIRAFEKTYGLTPS